MGRLISEDFDFLTETLALAKDYVNPTPDARQLAQDATFFARDVQSLMQALPRQRRQLAGLNRRGNGQRRRNLFVRCARRRPLLDKIVVEALRVRSNLDVLPNGDGFAEHPHEIQF